MRSPILGAAIDDLELLKRFVQTSTRVTHTDPKAEYGALAAAFAARMASSEFQVDPQRFAGELQRFLPDQGARELHALVGKVVNSLARDEPTGPFASSLGLERGVTGYVYHTAPVALHAWFSHPWPGWSGWPVSCTRFARAARRRSRFACRPGACCRETYASPRSCWPTGCGD